MSPMVSPGEHMFKVCFQSDPSQGADPRWLPGQSGAAGRQLMALAATNSSDFAKDAGHGSPENGHERQIEAVASVNSPITVKDVNEGLSVIHTGGLGQSVPNSYADLGQDSNDHVLPQGRLNGSLLQHVASHQSEPDSSRLSMSLPESVEHIADLQTKPQKNGDRIGRVALASEHRKIIQEHIHDSAEAILTCPQYLIYVGTAGQLMQAVQVSDYVPKFSFIPLHWPHMIEQMLVYTFAVSAALALINMAPIWYLDGEAALIEVVKLRGHSDMFYSPAVQPPRMWGRLLRLVLGFGTGVFVCVLALHMMRLLGYDAVVGHMLHTLGKLLSFVMT